MEAEKKRKILFWIAITIGCILLGVFFSYFSFIGQFHRYRDDMYKFTIKFPKRWEYKVHPMPGGAILFKVPNATGEVGFSETINIAVQDLPRNIATLRELTDTVRIQMQSVFTNLTVEQSVPVQMGDRKAWLMVFAAEKPDAVRIYTAWTIKDADKAYILTYIARTPYYAEYLPLVQYMMKTFKTFK